MNGLNACSKETENVLIHDAARPYVSICLIENVIKNLKNFEAVIPVLNCTDSLLQINSNSFNYLERERKCRTPNCFNKFITYEQISPDNKKVPELKIPKVKTVRLLKILKI